MMKTECKVPTGIIPQAKWDQITREKMEVNILKSDLRNFRVPPYFESKFGQSFLNSLREGRYERSFLKLSRLHIIIVCERSLLFEVNRTMWIMIIMFVWKFVVKLYHVHWFSLLERTDWLSQPSYFHLLYTCINIMRVYVWINWSDKSFL